MEDKEILENLCYYDLRNPTGIVDDIPYIIDDEEKLLYGNHSKSGCFCDNCYYGRTKLAEHILNNNLFIQNI